MRVSTAPVIRENKYIQGPADFFATGMIFFGLKRYNQALAQFDKALAMIPQEGILWVQLLKQIGKCYLALKRYEPAKKFLLQALELSCDRDWEILLDLKTCCLALKENDLADGYYRRALELGPRPAQTP